MRRRVSGFVAGIGLVLAVAVGPVAAAQDAPGTPGDPNCHGQSVAYLAQVFGVVGVNGIGNLAKALDISVKDVQAIVDEFCNS